MTTDEARKRREFAEAAILGTLKKLSEDTGLDLAAVEVTIYVDAAHDGEPRRVVHAVRIDLAV